MLPIYSMNDRARNYWETLSQCETCFCVVAQNCGKYKKDVWKFLLVANVSLNKKYLCYKNSWQNYTCAKLYKIIQNYVVQNFNVISSTTCNVLCFKKHHRVSPIKCFMLETSPFAVTPSTKLPSSPILSPPSSSLSSLSSLSSISTSPS